MLETRNFQLFSDKILRDTNILVVSDMHLCSSVKNGSKHIKELVNNIDYNNVNYIAIVDDIINDTSDLNKENF